MAAGEVEDTPATETSAGATSHLPSFVELLTRHTLGLAQRASDAVEERDTFEASEIVASETGTATWIEAQIDFRVPCGG